MATDDLEEAFVEAEPAAAADSPASRAAASSFDTNGRRDSGTSAAFRVFPAWGHEADEVDIEDMPHDAELEATSLSRAGKAFLYGAARSPDASQAPVAIATRSPSPAFSPMHPSVSALYSYVRAVRTPGSVTAAAGSPINVSGMVGRLEGVAQVGPARRSLPFKTTRLRGFPAVTFHAALLSPCLRVRMRVTSRPLSVRHKETSSCAFPIVPVPPACPPLPLYTNSSIPPATM
jgi:hypothetical protein